MIHKNSVGSKDSGKTRNDYSANGNYYWNNDYYVWYHSNDMTKNIFKAL